MTLLTTERTNPPFTRLHPALNWSRPFDVNWLAKLSNHVTHANLLRAYTEVAREVGRVNLYGMVRGRTTLSGARVESRQVCLNEHSYNQHVVTVFLV